MVLTIMHRVLASIGVLFGVALVTFFLMHQAPGGPFDRQDRKVASARVREALNSYYGLDKPQYFNADAASTAWREGDRNPLTLTRTFLDSQFFNYLFNAVQGDLGPSYQHRGKSVQDILWAQWRYSFILGLMAFLITVLIALPLGVITALNHNSWLDRVSLMIATIGVAIPSFIIGMLVLVVFGYSLQWFETRPSYDSLSHYLAPALVLAFTSIGFLTRMTRSEVLDMKSQDYMRTAYAKGLPSWMIMWRYIGRNAAIPIVTILGPLFVDFILGAVIIEAIFGIPGIGKYFVDSINKRDYSMIMGTTLFYATAIILINLIVDLSYQWIDPRIRTQG